MGAPNILPDPQQWFDAAPNNAGYTLLDPITGDRMNPNVVPSYITDDPHLHAGISYLQGRGSDVGVTVAYGRHRFAEDLGTIKGDGGWFEDQVRGADYYTYEGFGNTRDNESMRRFFAGRVLLESLQIGRDLSAFTEVYNKNGIEDSAFTIRTMRAVAISATPAFSPDIAGDGTPVERELVARYKELERSTPNEAAAIAQTALENGREWCIVAKTGLGILRGEASNLRAVEAFGTLGAAHKDVTRKFRLLGAVVRPKLVRLDALDDERSQVITVLPDVFASGTIVPEYVPVLHRLQQERHKLAISGTL